MCFSQNPELFYEDGGDLGSIEIRNEYVYYIDQNEGLKQLSLSDPNEAVLLVNTPGGVKHIFWNPDESNVYFGYIFLWYRAPFSTSEVSEASFFMDFTSQSFFDIKQYNNEYYGAFSDVGTFFFKLTNIDPIEGAIGLGSSEGSVRNIAVSGTAFYFSDDITDNVNDDDFGLYRATIGSFEETRELLVDFNEPISQLETQENFVYVLLQESNSIAVFDSNQPDPWIPINVITLDPSIYTIENIVIDDTDLYFTDSNQGAIFLLTDAALSLEENTSFTPFIFPNPVVDNLFFQGEGVSELRILDTNGRIVVSNKGSETGSESVIDVSHLSKGVYIAHFILKDDKSIVKRFIKK
ncbi:MAG: hypothetical protein ACI9Y7_003031 [Dokdonia sp.]|jgi:hypothetical protein